MFKSNIAEKTNFPYKFTILIIKTYNVMLQVVLKFFFFFNLNELMFALKIAWALATDTGVNNPCSLTNSIALSKSLKHFDI